KLSSDPRNLKMRVMTFRKHLEGRLGISPLRISKYNSAPAVVFTSEVIHHHVYAETRRPILKVIGNHPRSASQNVLACVRSHQNDLIAPTREQDDRYHDRPKAQGCHFHLANAKQDRSRKNRYQKNDDLGVVDIFVETFDKEEHRTGCAGKHESNQDIGSASSADR